MKLKGDTKLVIASVVVLGFGLWYMKRQLGNAAGAAWSGLTGAAGDAWTSLANGAQTPWLSNAAASGIEYAGLAVGIPRTNQSECDRAKAEGRWWDASFACPALDFIQSGAGAMWGSSAVRAAEQADVRRVDNGISLLPGQGYTDPSTGAYTPWGALPL